MDKPTISYQSQPTWEIHLVNINDDGIFETVDLSSAVAWRAAVDIDFDSETSPMIRTTDEYIDKSNASEGILYVILDANTDSFFEKIDKKASRSGTFQLRGSNSNGRIIYDFSLSVNCLGTVDPFGLEPLPVEDGQVSKDWVYSVIRGALNYQFSVDGVNDWHETRTSDDNYFRTNYQGGEYSEAVLIVDGTNIEIGTVTTGEANTDAKIDPVETVDEYGQRTITLNFTIPRGEDGEDAEQITYTEGTGIEITENNVINCTVTPVTYTQGTGIEITEDNVINCTVTPGEGAEYTQGTGIEITSDNVINCTVTPVTYTQGTGIEITEDNVINCTVTPGGGSGVEYTQGTGIEITSDNVINCTVTPVTYKEGTGIEITDDNTINCTITPGGGGVEYTEGTGIEITSDNVINCTVTPVTYKEGTGIEITDDNTINCTLTYTEGSGIKITENNVISADFDVVVKKDVYTQDIGTINAILDEINGEVI